MVTLVVKGFAPGDRKFNANLRSAYDSGNVEVVVVRRENMSYTY